jgi:hypothetical protein
MIMSVATIRPAPAKSGAFKISGSSASMTGVIS